jgi:hypothetical protein
MTGKYLMGRYLSGSGTLIMFLPSTLTAETGLQNRSSNLGLGLEEGIMKRANCGDSYPE